MNGMRSKKSFEIGQRIGMDLTEAEAIEHARAFLGSHSEDWGGLLDSCTPYREREIRLYKTLKEWKLKSIWEMRFSGYGGVDPVRRYTFYIASLFGLIAIIGLGLSIVQTHVGFKVFVMTAGQIPGFRSNGCPYKS
jgi:hypothetical protein